MAKSQDTKKTEKKKPQKTPKEKRAGEDQKEAREINRVIYT